MLRLFQIWFDAESRKNCFEHDTVTLYHNRSLNHYFENQVILDQRPYSSDYVGVWSHKAEHKIVRGGNRGFTLEKLNRICDRGGFDVLGFHHRHRQQIILYDSVRRKFDTMFDYLMKQLGVTYRARTTPRFIILQNHFVATAEVMNAYCAFLAKAVDIMEHDPTLKTELHRRAPYKPDSTVEYTFHPFICEKLVSAYLHLNRELVCKFYKDCETEMSSQSARR